MKKVPYEKQELEKWCNTSDSYNEVLVKSGRTKSTPNREILKKYINLYNIDVSHFTSSTSPKKEKNHSQLKVCMQCGVAKDQMTDYYWSNGHTRNICKECVKQNEREKYRHKMEEKQEYKQNLSCKKCGEKRFYLLDFHHRNPKEKDYTISDKSRLSLSQLQNEIDKCDVLCANCHREWHYLSQHDSNLEYHAWLGE